MSTVICRDPLTYFTYAANLTIGQVMIFEPHRQFVRMAFVGGCGRPPVPSTEVFEEYGITVMDLSTAARYAGDIQCHHCRVPLYYHT